MLWFSLSLNLQKQYHALFIHRIFESYFDRDDCIADGCTTNFSYPEPLYPLKEQRRGQAICK
jgi:hypothetical protein